MYRLYCHLKDHSPKRPATEEEKDITCRKIPLTAEKEATVLNELDLKAESLKAAFIKQQECAMVSLLSVLFKVEHLR